MSIITVGIDLAKNVFAVHGVDDNGKPVLVKPKVARDKLAELISALGIVLPQQVACLRWEIGAHLEDLPGYANRCIGGRWPTPMGSICASPSTTASSPKRPGMTRAADA